MGGRFPLKVSAIGRNIEIINKNTDNVEATNIGENYFSIFKGSGLEFEGYREYSLADDSRNIDWKASLRSDKLLVKEFLQEKGMDVIFVYDVSQSMLFGSHQKIKAHYGAEFILTLAGTAIESSYNVGLICFSDKIKELFLPSMGEHQLGIFFNVLGRHKTYGGGFNFKEASNYVDGVFKPGSVVVLVSDFLGTKVPIGKYKEDLRKLAKKFDLICIILRDERDEVLPSKSMNVILSDPYNDKKILVNPKKIKKRYEEYAKKQKKYLKNVFKDINADYIELYTNKSFVDPTIEFFKRRDALLR